MKAVPPQVTDITIAQQLLLQQAKTIDALTAQIATLQTRLDQLIGILYGQKAEKRPSKVSKAEPATDIKQSPAIESKSSKPKKNGRRQLPPELPRISIEHDIAEEKKSCKSCSGTPLKRIGQCITEQLEFKPAEFYVKKHIRHKYACPCCRGNVQTAELPPQPIEKGLPGPGLITEVLLNKYQDALPLYRQQQRFARLGVDLPRSTLCDWVTQSSNLLEALVDTMRSDDLLPSMKVYSDDTTVPVLAKGKTHTGRLWVYLGGGREQPICAIYDYTKTRRKEAPKKFLEGFKGYLHVDAYAGYDELCKDGNVIKCVCWAHARRKFYDVVKTAKSPGVAHKAMDFIAELYTVERDAKYFTAEERKAYRRRYSKAILKKFRRWLIRQAKKVPPKTPTGAAIAYTLNQWRELVNYLRDGNLEIDNNRSERAIKPLVIGRKNWLFAGSHEGAKNAAVIYSLIETCKMNGINTMEYFQDILTQLPSCKMNEIKTLLPYNWVPSCT